MASLTPANVWDRVKGAVAAGERLRSWSVERGEGTSTFEIVEVAADRLRVRLDSTKGVRTISHRQFERLACVWDDYLAGRVQRQALRPLSLNTSYALPIMRKADA